MLSTRVAAISLASLVALGAAGAALPAGAATTPKAATANATCSKGSVANLQLAREDTGKLTFDVGVDMAKHTAGVAWRVHVVDNGKPLLATSTRTQGDGSFSITRALPSASRSTVVATMRNPVTGETCKVTATL